MGCLARIFLDRIQDFAALRAVGIKQGVVTRPVAGRAEFVDKVAEVRIRCLMDEPGQPHANLGAVVAAEHGPVLNEGHLNA